MDKLDELVKILKKHGPEAEDAFQQFYEVTNRTALAVIKRYCDIPGDYEDLLQETYIRVYKSIDTLKDDTKALAWIRTIAGNTAVRHNMKKWPKMFSELMDEEGEIPDIEDESKTFDPAAIADRKAVSEAVTQILDTLPYDQRTALWMVYGQQITIKEMAESLGIPENTIKSRLYQGRNKLLSRKEEFRKLGVELTAIPVAVLISMAFDDTVYAAAGAGISAAGAGISTAGAGMTKTSVAGSGMAKTGMAGTARSAVLGTVAKGKAALAGLSAGAKAGIVAVCVFAVAGGGLAAKAASSPYMEPIEYKIECYNNREYGMKQVLAVYYPEHVSKETEKVVKAGGGSLDQMSLEQWKDGKSYPDIFFREDDSIYDTRYGTDWKITCKKISAEKLGIEKMERIQATYRDPMVAYPKSGLYIVYSDHREEQKELEKYFKGISVTEAYQIKVQLTIDGSKKSTQTEKEAIVVKYGNEWVLYPGSPDDLVYRISFPASDAVEKTEHAAEQDETQKTAQADAQKEKIESKDPYDNRINNLAIINYKDIIEREREDFTEETQFGVIDVNQDGIYEVYAYTPPKNDGSDSTVLFYYNQSKQGFYCAVMPEGNYSYIPETGQIICVAGDEEYSVELHEIDSVGVKNTESFSCKPAENDGNKERLENLLKDAVSLKLVPATQENLDYYLSGNGVATETVEAVLPETKKSNGGINAQALAAYCETLLYDERMMSPGIMGETKFSIVDINDDGINEVYVFVPGTSNGDTHSYLLYYTDRMHVSEPLLCGSFGIMTDESKFICGYSHMSTLVRVYTFDGKTLELVEEFGYEHPEMPNEYNRDPEKYDRLAAYDAELTSKAYSPETVPVGRENLYWFFGEAAKDVIEEYYGSLPWGDEPDGEEFSAQSLDFDLQEEIQRIRELYAYINEHLGTYERSSVNKNENAMKTEQDSTYFYNGDVQVKQTISAPNEGFNIEVYDKEPDLDSSALSTMDTMAHIMARFVFATDSAGNEYRIYMKDGFVIRYIGPDRNSSDYPEGKSLEDFMREDVDYLYGGDSVRDIIDIALTGWWIGEEH